MFKRRNLYEYVTLIDAFRGSYFGRELQHSLQCNDTESQTKMPDVFRLLVSTMGASVRLFARSPVIPTGYIAGFAQFREMISQNTFRPLFHIFNNSSCTVIVPLGTLEED